MEGRFAFCAQFWGNHAVVCRAVEDRPGPVVEQQFGQFPSWTQAAGFANKLNDGLNLDPLEIQQIVTSSLLATACVLQEPLDCRSLWNTVALETGATHLRFVMAEVTLSLTFCRSAAVLSNPSAQRVLLSAQNALRHASLFLGAHAGDDPQMREIVSYTRALDAALQVVGAPVY